MNLRKVYEKISEALVLNGENTPVYVMIHSKPIVDYSMDYVGEESWTKMEVLDVTVEGPPVQVIIRIGDI